MISGRLLLIPVPLGASPPECVLPSPVIELAKNLKHFVAENAKSARIFLKALPSNMILQEITIRELNEHTPRHALEALLDPLLDGFDVGLISEAGCPAVADPGSHLVTLAYAKGIKVIPMVGPSSILLALMSSGLSGQSFEFHGYLPAKPTELQKQLKILEKESRHSGKTQIFIETPYRNRQMLETLLSHCDANTRICVATNLTLDNETIGTYTVSEWKRKVPPEIDRQPTVFLMQA